MADKTNVKFLSGNLSDIGNVAKRAGQILFATDTDKNGYIYFDVSENLRLKMGAKADYAIKAEQDILGKTFTSTYLSNAFLTKSESKNTFTFTTPDTTETVIELVGASTAEAGLITTENQDWTGVKGFYRSRLPYYSKPNTETFTYGQANIKLYGDVLSLGSDYQTNNFITVSLVGTSQELRLTNYTFNKDDTDHGYHTSDIFKFDFKDKIIGNESWTFAGNSATASQALLANEASAVAWSNITNCPTDSIISNISLNNETGNLSVYTLDNTELTNGSINVAPLTEAGGTIPLDFIPLLSLNKIPQGALDRLVKVANEDALLALNTNTVQLGDSVLVTESKVMYIVIDESKLGTKDAFQEYKADTALKAFADEDGKNIKASYLSSVSGAHAQTGGFNLTFLNGQSDTSVITIPMASNSINGLMSKEDKLKMDDLSSVIEYEKIFYATDFSDPTEHGWIDTGIEGNSHLETGTYIVQIYNNNTSTSGFYKEYWSGVMSWYSETTNSTTHSSDEIYLHNCGYADTSSGKDLYLRTIRSASTDEKKTVRLQLAYGGTTFPTSLTVKFRFRKML